MKYFYKYLPVVLMALMACGKDEPVSTDKGLDYFPLQKGLYQIYQVDSIFYASTDDPDTLVYELKTEVIDSFPNAEGTYTYVIHLSKRTSENVPWVFAGTWSARVSPDGAVVNEGNISFVKVFFPVRKGNSWNGNKYNNLKEDKYVFEQVDVQTVLGGMTFDKTLTVEQENNDDPIVFTDLREEVYARGIGLIYKETTQLHYCTTQGCLGKQIIENGTIYKQEIKEYGIR